MAITSIAGVGGVAGMAGTLRSLLEQVAAAARSHNSQGDGRSGPQDPAPDLHAPDQQAPDQHTRTVAPGGGNARMVFGYTLRMGPDGIAAEPFGHVPPTYVPSAHVPPTHVPSAHVPSANASASTAAPVALQPIVEVYQDGATVVVIAELPGADPDRHRLPTRRRPAADRGRRRAALPQGPDACPCRSGADGPAQSLPERHPGSPPDAGGRAMSTAANPPTRPTSYGLARRDLIRGR